MRSNNKSKKYNSKSKHYSKYNKTKKYLAKKNRTKKNRTKSQHGGYESMSLTNNPLVWTIQGIGNSLINTLNGTTIPPTSSPTNGQFE